ncbi:MAG: ATP-binding cassette domain-containing protein [Chloroflexi bacterium]|nr:ATP-binding cassette domain-containing protein [Chloroflexota bacterium]
MPNKDFNIRCEIGTFEYSTEIDDFIEQRSDFRDVTILLGEAEGKGLIRRDEFNYPSKVAQLEDFTNRRASKLSGGMKKKLALACTLLHHPPLLLLDEPTTGVDPVSRREFWTILNDLHLNGTTIVVSTPYMDEADRCSRVGLIYQGRIVICDSPTAIRNQLPGEVIKIVTSDWQKAREILLPLAGVLEVQSYGESLHVLVDSIDKRTRIVTKTLEKHNLKIHEIRGITPRMEEAFISLIRKMDQGQ